jgi:hypothetical protein
MLDLMAATITDGTGRKRFSDAKNHRILSRLLLGGKSGSINDETGARVDWFVAFAIPRQDGGPGSLALAAVVVHQGVVRASSQELVRKAILGYYSGRLGDDSPMAASGAGKEAPAGS